MNITPIEYLYLAVFLFGGVSVLLYSGRQEGLNLFAFQVAIASLLLLVSLVGAIRSFEVGIFNKEKDTIFEILFFIAFVLLITFLTIVIWAKYILPLLDEFDPLPTPPEKKEEPPPDPIKEIDEQIEVIIKKSKK